MKGDYHIKHFTFKWKEIEAGENQRKSGWTTIREDMDPRGISITEGIRLTEARLLETV